jgi:hypothetical protein
MANQTSTAETPTPAPEPATSAELARVQHIADGVAAARGVLEQHLGEPFASLLSDAPALVIREDLQSDADARKAEAGALTAKTRAARDPETGARIRYVTDVTARGIACAVCFYAPELIPAPAFRVGGDQKGLRKERKGLRKRIAGDAQRVGDSLREFMAVSGADTTLLGRAIAAARAVMPDDDVMAPTVGVAAAPSGPSFGCLYRHEPEEGPTVLRFAQLPAGVTASPAECGQPLTLGAWIGDGASGDRRGVSGHLARKHPRGGGRPPLYDVGQPHTDGADVADWGVEADVLLTLQDAARMEQAERDQAR